MRRLLLPILIATTLTSSVASGATRTHRARAAPVHGTFEAIETETLLSAARADGCVAIQFEVKGITFDEFLGNITPLGSAWVVPKPGTRIVYLGTLPANSFDRRSEPLKVSDHRATITGALPGKEVFRATSDFLSVSEDRDRLIIQIYLRGIRFAQVKDIQAEKKGQPPAKPKLVLVPQELTVVLKPGQTYILTRIQR